MSSSQKSSNGDSNHPPSTALARFITRSIDGIVRNGARTFRPRPEASSRKPHPIPILLLASLLASGLGGAQAQEAGAPKESGFDRLLDQAKHPASWLNLGSDLRYRNEYFDNVLSITDKNSLHETDVNRFRARLWASATVVTNLSINGRLVAEPRLWSEPSFVSAFKGRSGMEWRFGTADSLNVKWANVLGQPLTLTVGRQDIMPGEIGDGWLVGDGTPLDGSMTFYFDALRAQYTAEPINTKFDLSYIYQNPRPGEPLPSLGDSSDYLMTEQQEQGVVFYAANRSIPSLELDGYAIYKHDRRQTFTLGGANVTPGDNADIYTLGGRLLGTPGAHWKYSAEGAYQFGWKQDTISGNFASRDLAAYGGKAALTYAFHDSLKNELSLFGEYLSGDDPSTQGTDEMFDALWGRWPQWSDLYAYSYTPEVAGRTAQFNNLGRPGISWGFSPAKNFKISLTYSALLAPEATPTRTASPLFSHSGNFRGHFGQVLLKYRFTEHLCGHLLGEWMAEGNYYSERQVMTFGRLELFYTF